jgi:hypothetical protein
VFDSLTTVDLFLQNSFPESVNLMMQQYTAQQSIKVRFDTVFYPTDWWVNINVFTPPFPAASTNKTRAVSLNLWDEIRAFNNLSLGEQAIAAAKGVQFSEVVARTSTGNMRERGKYERILFETYWGTPLWLFTSPNFRFERYWRIRLCRLTSRNFEFGEWFELTDFSVSIAQIRPGFLSEKRHFQRREGYRPLPQSYLPEGCRW